MGEGWHGTPEPPLLNPLKAHEETKPILSNGYRRGLGMNRRWWMKRGAQHEASHAGVAALPGALLARRIAQKAFTIPTQVLTAAASIKLFI